MKISMIGPVPIHWGGGSKWRGGGVSTHIQGLLGALAEQPIEIRLLADNVEREVSLSTNSPPTISIHPLSRSFFQLIRRNPRLVARLVKRISIKEIRDSIPWLQLIRFLGLALNYEYFLQEVPPEIVHVQHILHRPYLCRRVLQSDLPFIVTVQSVNYLMEPDNTWHIEMAHHNYTTADRLIAVSRYVKDMMVQHGAEAERVVVIPNGVDIDMFVPGQTEAARKKLGLPSDSFIVLFTGNLVPRKGVNDLLKAFQKAVQTHPNSLLLILGDGDDHDKLTQLAQTLEIAKQVRFAGFRTLPEMPLWYQACDLFVMPSWAEGLSLSILEAMASAKPVITTFPTIGEHDAVEADETGWLMAYGDVDGLAEVLVEVMERPELIIKMGQKARQVAEAHFSWRSIGERTMTVYQEVLAEREHAGRLHSL